MNTSNFARLKELFRRAAAGQELTIGFLGGSITQGSLSTQPGNAYAFRVYQWFVDTFPQSKFHYVNGGIGGTSFSGGVGTAMGTLVGAFIMGFLNNIMNLLGIQSYLQQIIKGGIIVAAVAYDIMSKNKKTASQLGNIEERGKEA